MDKTRSGNSPRLCVGLAIQGGVIPAGAFAAGVVRALVDAKAFDSYDFVVFSGTSSGALVASLCWGHLLEGRIEEAPAALRQQWLDIAYGIVPDAKAAQAMLLADQLSRLNPAYDLFAQNMVVPFVRRMMQDWVSKHLNFEKWPRKFEELKASTGKAPGLLLGATDILEGDIRVFQMRNPSDFRLETVLASGSIPDMNGMTHIKEGPQEGFYQDGAWAINPALSEMIDYGIDEIWLVQIWPKRRSQVPGTLAEREDRKDELWQNSLVEHELRMINFVNKWRKALNDGISEVDPQHPPFRPIEIKMIPMERDLPSGATIINSAYFVEEMMDYGYHQGHRFMEQSAPALAAA